MRVLALLIFAAFVAAGDYQVRFEGGLKILSFDNVTLSADGYIPIPKNSSERFPVLVFPNSWGMPQIEYILKTLNFAADGYIAIEYETRGWWSSGGQIDTAGPKDVQDAAIVVDYILSMGLQWQVDNNNIAFVGISYGAGLSYLAAANDPRVKTAVAMSGWGNITEALYENQTPSLIWGELLIIAAELLGRAPDSLFAMWNELINHKNLTAVKIFGESRSPITQIGNLNARNVPIFMSNNFLDRLFNPCQMIDFFEKLTVPKMLLLNKGMHAEAEGFGLFDIPNNYVWGKARLWLDYWLKGIPTGIMQEPQVQMQAGTSVLTGPYVTFPQWPDPTSVTKVHYGFTTRGSGQFGGLVPTNLKETSGTSNLTADQIQFSELPGISSGFPLVADALHSIGIDDNTELALVSKSTAILYKSDQVQQTMRICGVPRLNVSVQANNWVTNGDWQLFGFLYDIGDLDVGTLISDSRFSHWQNMWGAPKLTRQTALRRNVRGDTTVSTIENWEFHGICREIAAGHRIGVGFALYSNLYKTANSSSDLRVNFAYGGFESVLEIPVSYV